MTKKELREIVREIFKQYGYRSLKSGQYLNIDEDYLIGFYLDPCSYIKGYYFSCGCIYLPDPDRTPFFGSYDLRWDFCFPEDPTQEFDIRHSIDCDTSFRICEYEKYTVDQFRKIFDTNFDYFMLPLYNKDYGLQHFRKDVTLMRGQSDEKIKMLCQRANLDLECVMQELFGS